MFKEQIAEWFQGLQDRICKGLEEIDGIATFQEDKWEREGGGGGRTRVIANGRVIVKGGVNWSAVYGPTPENILKALNLPTSDFFASGVSIVLHSENPLMPIIHMNVRLFEMSDGTWWFGGGIDLTPHYVFPEDAEFFHQYLRATCDKHNPSFYPKFKKWADDYFYIKHRHETRGIGGIFFDRMDTSTYGMSKEDLFAFVQDVGESFVPIYKEMAMRNAEKPYTNLHKEWQFMRRGRYAEFNLVYDKGTKFGLDTEGRTESILMSLPPMATWEYNHVPQPNSAEELTLSLLKKGIDWVK